MHINLVCQKPEKTEKITTLKITNLNEPERIARQVFFTPMNEYDMVPNKRIHVCKINHIMIRMREK